MNDNKDMSISEIAALQDCTRLYQELQSLQFLYDDVTKVQEILKNQIDSLKRYLEISDDNA